MTPAYVPGAIVVVRKKSIRVGDAVLARIDAGEVFKRVISREDDIITLANDHQPRVRTEILEKDVTGVVVYTFPMTTPAPKPRKRYGRVVASVAAAVLMVMAALQLISFDTFIPILDSYWLPINGALLGAILVTLTVAALPFLLYMKVSQLARLVSVVAGWLIAICWLLLGVYTYTTVNALSSTGHLGGIIATSPGVWTVLFGVVLCVLVAVAHWSLGLSFRKVFRPV